MANTGDLKPTYIYKLIPSDATPPDPLPAALPIPNTLRFFFTNEPRVYVLRIPYDPLETQIKWEDPKAEVCGPRGGEGMFPHLYNGFKLGKGEIESVATWERKEGESWDSVLERAQDWLVY